MAQRSADLAAPSFGSPEHASPRSATPPLSKSLISKFKNVKHCGDTETSAEHHPTKPQRSGRRSRLESGNGNQNPEAYIASDWKSHENRRKILEAAAAQLGLTGLSGWYKVKISDLKGTEAHRMIRQEFDGSLWNALVECFSEHNWQAWMLGRIPTNWWMERKNQRQYVDEYLSPALGITSLSGWYSVTEDQMIAAGAGRLLSIYDSSTSNILTTLYQEHTWELWRFPKIPRGFWIDPENCRQFLESMSSVLGIQKKEDWNQVTLSQLSKAAGRKTSLRIPSPKGDRNLSLFELLKRAYPEDWKAWQRSKVPKGFWASLEQQRIFVEEIAKSIDAAQSENDGLHFWYSVTPEAFFRHGGRKLIRRYDNSLIKMLQMLYPGHQWQPWKFSNVSLNYWDSLDNHKLVFDSIKTEFGILKPEDWYQLSVSHPQFDNIRPMLYHRYGGSLYDALRTVYPDHKWSRGEFARSAQRKHGEEPPES